LHVLIGSTDIVMRLTEARRIHISSSTS
jgi:hypothetical protein